MTSSTAAKSWNWVPQKATKDAISEGFYQLQRSVSPSERSPQNFYINVIHTISQFSFQWGQKKCNNLILDRWSLLKTLIDIRKIHLTIPSSWRKLSPWFSCSIRESMSFLVQDTYLKQEVPWISLLRRQYPPILSLLIDDPGTCLCNKRCSSLDCQSVHPEWINSSHLIQSICESIPQSIFKGIFFFIHSFMHKDITTKTKIIIPHSQICLGIWIIGPTCWCFRESHFCSKDEKGHITCN